MPHTARKLAESGVYHIVTKGDGNQIIFEDSDDRRHYIDLLEAALDSHKVSLNAYCLMSNHVHLLVAVQSGLEVKDGGEELSAFMKRLNESYAMYFQKKSKRVGHVFKGRFWSEAVETDEHFLCAIRYIHANPEPARICKAQEYPWSSYQAYCGKPSFVDTELALYLLGGIDGFKRFSATGGKYAKPFPESKLRKHLAPDEQIQIALIILGRETLAQMRQMKQSERKPLLQKLASAGFTETEIVRITGLGRQAIRSALRE